MPVSCIQNHQNFFNNNVSKDQNTESNNILDFFQVIYLGKPGVYQFYDDQNTDEPEKKEDFKIDTFCQEHEADDEDKPTADGNGSKLCSPHSVTNVLI
jgi:hypothetical protein